MSDLQESQGVLVLGSLSAAGGRGQHVVTESIRNERTGTDLAMGGRSCGTGKLQNKKGLPCMRSKGLRGVVPEDMP